MAHLTLNRPERHNAFDDHMISVLDDRLREIADRGDVRAVILAAEGKSFSAGADLDWMKRMAGYSSAENEADAKALGDMLARLNGLAVPTIALVQGGAYGGGVGLVAACDMAIAAEEAVFSLTEVRLGIIPSVVSPYVLAAIGARAARRYFLTAERFDAAEAYRMGLVHEVVPAAELRAFGDSLVKQLLAGSPAAIASAKQLIAHMAGRPVDEALIAETARRIAAARASEEGKEGISAFLERRKPDWVPAKEQE
ncbi:MAG: enoyl-CoA hydratase/isomerase family protein [Rhodospirillaceae bacterium]|nr:enoyl-CoA hydratase/isomerase family protein [Rhodospirillaceae bacterium]